ncbi:MAG: hypothetical protein K8T89_23990 [Planctomycetes bacterium]|nr:hypothetical protein [Planctomycetota bacterium]
MSSATAIAIEHLPDAPRLDPNVGDTLFQKVGIVTAVAGAALLVGWVIDDTPGKRQFYYSYLWGYMWALSVALGALFWNLIHHVTAAGWSVGIRRIFENIHRALPVLAVLFIPIAIGIGTIYKWSHADDLKNGKQIWLSPAFFLIRIAIYFSVWILYSNLMRKWSLQCDATDDLEERKKIQRKMEFYAPSGVLLLALTATFAVFDLVMSLNYHWFSTIFGVIFWADSIRGSLVSCVLIVLALHSAGYLKHTITREHFHDMGKLMFGFTVFWTYVSFSQYFLYWYGNIPEETKFYWDRRAGSWYLMSILLPICFFGVPFLILLPRGNKRNPKVIGFVAAWVLAFQMFHLYWEIMPEGLKANVHDRPSAGFSPHWLDAASIVMFGGVMIGSVLYGFRNHSLIPIRDVRLGESIHHEVDEFGDPA